MTEKEQILDESRTIVVLNVPSDVNEDDLEIHFQMTRNGGGDVEKIEFNSDRNLAFVTFDEAEGLKC